VTLEHGDLPALSPWLLDLPYQPRIELGGGQVLQAYVRPPLVLVSILPIVDRVSERTEATRRHLATLHRTSKVGALVITSRFPLPIDGVAPLTMAVNPLDPASLLHFTTALLRELSFHCHPFRAGCRRLMACQATPCSDCWMVLERLSRTKLSSNAAGTFYPRSSQSKYASRRLRSSPAPHVGRATHRP